MITVVLDRLGRMRAMRKILSGIAHAYSNIVPGKYDSNYCVDYDCFTHNNTELIHSKTLLYDRRF